MVRFHGGDAGPWRIRRMVALAGPPLPRVERLAIAEGLAAAPMGAAAWTLSGSTGNLRYTERAEADSLAARQQGLARPQALHAALIPIRKNEAWWALAQDERRAILEAESRHIAIGMDYLPAIARRLHHARELGEPFDFLTWFEYAPEHEPAFDEMLARLRAQREWEFVEREVEIRLVREVV
jgi:chlorite dismutase